MTCLGALLGLIAASGLLWLAMLTAAASIAFGDGGYAVAAIVFTVLALLLLRQMARERGVEL